MRIELQEALQDPLYLAALFGADVTRVGSPPLRIRGITTDTRELQKGDLFLAMKGERTDGNLYIDKALSVGACAVLTECACEFPSGNFWHFQCESVQDSLLLAAGKWRKECGACVIGVTGSAGKSTTKEAIAAVLGNAPHNAGNYNSMLGMPMSVLSFPKSRFWVCELGINHVGEMEKMSLSLCPDVGVITNVGSAHIGYFGDYSTVLKEKFKICAGMGNGGKLLLPLSLKKSCFSTPLCHIFGVGEENTADFVLENIAFGSWGTRCDLRHANGGITNLAWPMPGPIGSSVLGLSAAVGVLCGRDAEQIRTGVQNAARSLLHASVCKVGGMLFFEDCYNASPEACVAALEALRYLAGEKTRVAVLGDMLELGEYSSFLHRMLGNSAHKSGVSYLFTYGAAAAQIALGAKEAGMPTSRVFSFALGEEELLAQSVLKHAPSDAAVLFKASRAVRMENVAQRIRRLL